MKIQTLSIVAGTTACNARCPFCVSKMTCSNGIKSSRGDVNWRNFDKACRLAQISGVSTVMITGKGEPTLYPYQISSFLDAMKKYDFPLIELQTNGLLLNSGGGIHHLNSWHLSGLSTIAISVVHYCDELNHRIYNPHEEAYPSLTKTIKYLHEKGYSIRLSCVMVKGFIDSVKAIKGMIEYAKDNEVEQLTFTPVNRTRAVKDDKHWKWAEENSVDLDSLNCIRAMFENEEVATPLMSLSHGATIYDIKGQNVCYSECLTVGSKAQNKHPELRNLIFFPDGHLRYDWQYQGAILL